MLKESQSAIGLSLKQKTCVLDTIFFLAVKFVIASLKKDGFLDAMS